MRNLGYVWLMIGLALYASESAAGLIFLILGLFFIMSDDDD